MTESIRRVPDQELEYDENSIYTHNGVLFTGIGFDGEPGGDLSELSYRDGMQDGPSREWYPSGQLKSESYYRENVLHGPEREFDENGNILAESIYEYGIRIRSTRRDSSGAMIETFVIDPGGWHFTLLEKHRRERAWPTSP